LAKFPDTSLIDYKGSAYLKSLTSNCNPNIPLPPELLDPLRIRNPRPSYSKEAAESWTIGVLLLTAASLCTSNSLYIWDKFQLNTKSMTKKMTLINGMYSNLYNELMCACLSLDPSCRPSIQEIIGFINRRKSTA